MADKIIELCNNKKLREKITENGYKFVKKYNVNTIMKKWIRFYEV
jgi:glycosyltransferase involved in cell wall biosynthesis